MRNRRLRYRAAAANCLKRKAKLQTSLSGGIYGINFIDHHGTVGFETKDSGRLFFGD